MGSGQVVYVWFDALINYISALGFGSELGEKFRDRDGNLIRTVAVVNESLCQGCGPCAAICPSKSIEIETITEEQVYAQIMAY